MADERSVSAAGDHHFRHLRTKRLGSRRDIAVTQAGSLVLIGKQDIHMIMHKP